MILPGGQRSNQVYDTILWFNPSYQIMEEIGRMEVGRSHFSLSVIDDEEELCTVSSWNKFRPTSYNTLWEILFISIFYRELSTEKWDGHFLTGVNLVELVLIKFTDLGPGLGLGLLHTVRSVQYDVREAQTGVPPRGDLHLCSEGHPEVGALSSQLCRTELHEVNAMGDS